MSEPAEDAAPLPRAEVHDLDDEEGYFGNQGEGSAARLHGSASVTSLDSLGNFGEDGEFDDDDEGAGLDRIRYVPVLVCGAFLLPHPPRRVGAMDVLRSFG